MAEPSAAQRMPQELLCSIVEFVPRPSDLRSLCLTMKSFRDAATPSLYRNVVRNDKTRHWPLLQLGRGLLSMANPGLAYVRTLTCSSMRPSLVRHVTLHKNELQSIHMLLQFLPRHQLHSIDLSTIPPDEATVTALFTHQGTLRSLAMGPMVTNLNAHLQLNAFGNPFFRLQELQIPRSLWNVLDLEAYGTIIANAPQLSRLSIHCSQLVQVNMPYTLNATDWRDAIFSRLFPNQSTYFGNRRNPLLSLRLDRVNLSVAAPLFPQYFDLSKIQELYISSCEAWASLLRTLTGHFLVEGAQLRRFSLELGEQPLPSDRGVLEQFMGSFDGLETLRYSDKYSEVMPSGLPPLKLRCLNRHLATLRQLAILSAAAWHHGLNKVDMADEYFDKISAGCLNLRQLGVVMPRTPISGQHKNHEYYAKTLRKLLALPKLGVLRIFNWPGEWKLPLTTLSPHLLEQIGDEMLASDIELEMADQTEEIEGHLITQIMDRFVARLLPQIFRATQRGDCFPLVCYSGAGHDYATTKNGNPIDLYPACYAMKRQLNVFGDDEAIAHEYLIDDVKHLEPESDILQWYATAR